MRQESALISYKWETRNEKWQERKEQIGSYAVGALIIVLLFTLMFL